MHDKAERLKRMKTPAVEVDPKLAHRLPPGQMLTERFPILHEGDVPHYEPGDWQLRIFGEVANERVFTLEDIQAMPAVKIVCDIH